METLRRIKVITAQIGKTLEVTGPFNIQFLAKENDIKVIECNLRASRSFPFVSKITNVNLAEISTRAIISMLEQRRLRTSFDCNLLNIPYVGVKAPQFSFSRLKGADPILSVEMASTGEVAALGKNLEEAYLKSIIATGFNLPKKGVLLSLGGELNKTKFLSSAKNLYESGLKIYATHHTMLYLRGHGMEAVQLYKLHEMPQEPNIKTYLLKEKIDLVITINDFDYKKPIKADSLEVDDDYMLRRNAVDLHVPILTDLQTARLFVRAISKYTLKDLLILPWDWYLRRLNHN